MTLHAQPDDRQTRMHRRLSRYYNNCIEHLWYIALVMMVRDESITSHLCYRTLAIESLVQRTVDFLA